MGNFRQLSTNAYPLGFVLRLTADGSLATGKTPTVELSKDGGVYAVAVGAVVEVGYGQYILTPDANDRDTVGEVWAHITEPDCVEQTILLYNAVTDDPFTDVSVLEVPPAVWDVEIAGHINDATFGKKNGVDIQNRIASIPSEIWDMTASNFTEPDTVGYVLNHTAENVWTQVIEGTKSAAWFMRVFLAALVGKLTGVSADHPKFRDLLDTKDRIDATTNSDGRVSVTLDGD